MTEFRLHPRLLPGRAEALFAEYGSAVYGPTGSQSVESLLENASTDVRGRVFAATGPPRVSGGELTVLREAVVTAAERHGFPRLFPSQAQRAAFDSEATRIYSTYSRLFPAEAAIKSVWSHHALVLLPDITFWRWPPKDNEFGRMPTKDRYIPGRIDRHAYARLWWRAAQVLARAEDLEAAAQLLDGVPEGEIDWIFARHDAFGGSPEAVRCILDIWSERTRQAPLVNSLVPRRRLLKAWLMALLRRGAFIVYDLLEPQATRREFEAVLDGELVAMMPTWRQPSQPPVELTATGAQGREPVAVEVGAGSTTASHQAFITAAFARALPNEEPVVISVTDRLAIQGARDDGVVLVELVDPRGVPPQMSSPANRERLLEMGFHAEPLGYARRIELSGDETSVVVGAVLARALADAFAVPSTTLLRLD